MSEPPVVAVINSTPDIVDMLRVALQQAGFVVITGLTFEIRDGEIDLDRFIGQHEPRVVVYDIAPPYDANWDLFQHIRAMAVMRGREFVVTSTNPAHVVRLAGQQREIYEVVGKPYDLDRIVQAVKEATRSRPTC